MMILLIMGVLVGVVLGLRFKVFVLVPVICVALAVVVVEGIASGDELWRLALAMIVIATSLQLGYFLGTVGGAARTSNDGRVSIPTSAGMSGSV
jgi:hypothetical protein